MPTVPQVRTLHYNGEDIGMGFNSDTGLAVGTALDFDAPTNEPGQQAHATAHIVNTHESLMQSLNMSAEVEGHYAFSSASLKVDFSQNTSYNSVSTFVVAKMVINNQVRRGRNFRIKPEAQRLLDAHQTAEFERAFGDSFVRGQFSGGEYYAVIRLTSVDTAKQTSLAVTLEAEINGGIAGGSFKGSYNKAVQETSGQTELSVTYFQKGGVGEGEIGTTLDVEEVKERLHNFPTAVQNHPFPYEIEVATYDTIPLPVGTKEQQEDFLLALADADRKKLHYLQIRNDLEFAAEHPEYFEDPPPAPILLAAAAEYLRAVNAVIAHAVRLSRAEIDPPQFFDPSSLNPPLALPNVPLRKRNLALGAVSFSEWYTLQSDPSMLADDRKLVTKIANAGIQKFDHFWDIVDPGGNEATTNKMRGDALEAVVNQFTEMDFSESFEPENRLASVGHVSTMLPLNLSKLSFRWNQLLDLRGLEKFSSLTSLDLSVNQLGDITPLAALTTLKELDISHNHIADLTSLRAYLELEILNLSGNQVTDLRPLAALTKLTSLSIEGSVVFDNDTEISNGDNPIQIATGLGGISGIANPFFLADTLSVRLGVLKDGPEAQFTGTAKRVGRSNRFTVHLTRDGEVKEDEWRFLSVAPVDPFLLPSVSPGWHSVAMFGKDRKFCISLVAPGDPTKTAVEDVPPAESGIDLRSGVTFDAKVSA